MYKKFCFILLVCFFSINIKACIEDKYVLNLVEIINSKKIIGFGANIHGSNQPLKYITSHLKNSLNFKTIDICIEMPFKDSFVIKKYLDNKINSIDSVLPQLTFYFHQTKEFGSFLKEIKSLNNRVNVYGIDVRSKDKSIEYLLAKKLPNRLNFLLLRLKGLNGEKENYKERNNLIDSLQILSSKIISNDKLLNLSIKSILNWSEMTRLINDNKNNWVKRDSLMANMVESITKGNSQNIFVLAHNKHIGYGDIEKEGSVGVRNLGYFLKQRFKNQFYSIGTEIYHPKFIAKEYHHMENKYLIKEFSKINDCRKCVANILKLKTGNKTELISTLYFNEKKKLIFMNVGSVYYPKNKDYNYFSPQKIFDAILFFPSSKYPQIIKN